LILSDRDIRAALQRLEDPLIVDPGFDPARLQPASLELTLAADVLIERITYRRDKQGQRYKSVGWHESTVCLPQCVDEHNMFLQPGDFWLASTVEKVYIPTDLVAQVNGKSSLGRKGLVVHQTAGFIDPGFRGQITLELSNVSQRAIRLTVGMPICQLVFFQMTSPAQRPYGHVGLGSHYQGQQGPTSAR
jgi:dCTP deaminase